MTFRPEEWLSLEKITWFHLIHSVIVIIFDNGSHNSYLPLERLLTVTHILNKLIWQQQHTIISIFFPFVLPALLTLPDALSIHSLTAEITAHCEEVTHSGTEYKGYQSLLESNQGLPFGTLPLS